MRFRALILLALLLSLSCQWSKSASSDPKLAAQLNARVADDIHGDIHGDIRDAARLTPATTSFRFTEADFTRHVKELNARMKKRLSSRVAQGFSIVIQKPFVVIGDEPKVVVQQRAQDTVKWAVDRLKQDFFIKDPDDILDIWLFKDEASYEKHTRLLFGDTPTTPYGYYSSSQKALIMNIATGWGTLVHEIVHPFMEANFRFYSMSESLRVAQLYTQDPPSQIVMPLENVPKKQVANTWQAPRGKDRFHRGQDIFAQRGTSIYSATEGYVYRIGENALGGQTVSVIGAGGRV